MRVGQTSFVVFGSHLLGSVLGFAATLYFARIVGAEVLGYYALTLIVARWISVVGTSGVVSAVRKRVSEKNDPSAHFTAGIIAVVGLGIVCSVAIGILRGSLNAYIGAETWLFLILLVVVGLARALVYAGLEGGHRVHIAGLLTPVDIGVRSLIQIGLVFAGFSLSGMLVGYASGGLVVAVVGVAFLSVGVRLPSVEHFRSLFDFARFSWLGNLSGRTFNDMDVIVLGALVSPALVGVYAVAWSLTSFVGAFGSSIHQSTFPELSRASAEERRNALEGLLTDSLSNIGLFAIPGLFGAAVVGDRLLRLYGDEFVRGATVLVLLVCAMLLWDYQNQALGTLDAINRPDLSFRVNVVFVALNLGLNVALVVAFGWVGAAVATVLSTAVGLSLAVGYLHQLVDFSFPTAEIGRQIGAAAAMAIVVFGVRRLIESADVVNHNAAIVVLLVALGGIVYFLLLTAVSEQFRSTVAANSPVDLPFVS